MVDIKLPFSSEKQTRILFGNYPDHVDFLETTNTYKKAQSESKFSINVKIVSNEFHRKYSGM